MLGKVLAVMAAGLGVTLFTGGVAIAGSEIGEKARLELTSTGIRHFEGRAKLELQIKNQDETKFKTETEVEEGAVEHIVYSLWLGDQEGHTSLLDIDVAEEVCTFDPVDHSVEGLTINISEHFGSHASVVLIGTVTESRQD